jgi:uncharacterized RDD family membrane protein YckC
LFAPEDNRPERTPTPPAAPKPRAVPFQPSLFQEMTNVIPFRGPEPDASTPKPKKPRTTKAVKKTLASQESLSFDFDAPMLPGEEAWMVERGLGASAIAGRGANLIGETARPADSDIYCDAPVAPIAARTLAVVFDAALATGAYLAFAGAYWFMIRTQGAAEAAPAEWTWKAAIPYAALFVTVAVLYKSFWILCDAESAGARWARLRVLTFDGEKPAKADRFRRMAWWIFGAAAVGIGHLWALTDEEHLTWHDLLSETFVSVDNRR